MAATVDKIYFSFRVKVNVNSPTTGTGQYGDIVFGKHFTDVK